MPRTPNLRNVRRGRPQHILRPLTESSAVLSYTFGPKAQRKCLRIEGTFEDLGRLGAAAAEGATNAKATAELAGASTPAAMEQTHAD